MFSMAWAMLESKNQLALLARYFGEVKRWVQ